jgi:hypothetical protein
VSGMSSAAHQLAFHGSIILLYGLLTGIPYGRSVVRKAPDHIVHAWRLIHSALSIGAVLMYSVAALLPAFNVSDSIKHVISLSLIATAYSLGIAMTLGALTGERGLAFKGNGSARMVYVFNALGAFASLIGAAVLVYATYQSM